MRPLSRAFALLRLATRHPFGEPRLWAAACALALIVACSASHDSAAPGAGGEAGAARAGTGGEASTDIPPDEAGQGGAPQAGASGEDSPGGTVGKAGARNSSDGGLSGHGASASAGSDAAAAGSGSAGTSSGEAGRGGTASSDESMIPCDVYAAYGVCRKCHDEPPTAGAPFSLVSLADVQANAENEYNAIATGVMPAAGTLSPDEADLMLAWLLDGAKGVPKADCP